MAPALGLVPALVPALLLTWLATLSFGALIWSFQNRLLWTFEPNHVSAKSGSSKPGLQAFVPPPTVRLL